MWLYLSERELPRRADAIDDSAIARFRPLHAALLDRGLYAPPSAHEVMFLSTAHGEDDVRSVATAVTEELARLAERPS